ncbi:hypothetical protein LCGC14_2894640 [marine sediment metagenome]|uniref:Uncharacterized protein n=1 Tax=marine sediment metagenome TaxID=412755 RepID=A0A0F9A449_9ZZZZ
MKKKNVKVSKDAVINVRCTSKQKEDLEAMAARDGMGVSTWLLNAGLLRKEQRQEKRQ